MGIKAFFKQQQEKIKAADERNQQRIEEKAERDLEKARTESAKQIIKEKREQEIQRLKREAAEARIATNKAKAAAEKAKRESGDVGGINWGFGGGSKPSPATPKKAAKPRKAAKRKPAQKKTRPSAKNDVMVEGTFKQVGPSATVLSKERTRLSKSGKHTTLSRPTRTVVITPKRRRISR